MSDPKNPLKRPGMAFVGTMTKLRSAAFADFGWERHGWTFKLFPLPYYLPSSRRIWYRVWITIGPLTLRIYADTDFPR